MGDLEGYERYVLALTFLLACGPKLVHRHDFATAVRNYRLAPPVVSELIAAILPILELGVAILLLTDVLVVEAAAAALAMLVVFAAAVSANLIRGRVIDCGCAGAAAPHRISWPLVGRDLVLSAIASLLLAQRFLEPRVAAPTLTDELAILGAVVVLVLLERLVVAAARVAGSARAVEARTMRPL